MPYAVERLKEILGLGFAASDMGVIALVEAQKKALDDLKAMLGLPKEAGPAEIQGGISALKAENEELLKLKGEWQARPTGFWQKLFGGK